MSQIASFNTFFTNDKTNEYLQKVLGESKKEFVTNCISVVNGNAKLLECSPKSLMYAALKATSIGLVLDSGLGHAFVVPYAKEAQLQIGYKGFIQLAIRTNKYETINVTNVVDGEYKGVDRLTGKYSFEWIDDPKERSKKPVIGYLAYFKLLNGYSKMKYMTVDEIEKHGKEYSKTFNNEKSRWQKDREGMSAKTVLKLLLNKYAPLSIEMKNAIKYDQAVVKDNHLIEYPDNPDSINVEVVKEKNKSDDVTEVKVDPKTRKLWITEINNIQSKDEISDYLATKDDETINNEAFNALLTAKQQTLK